MESPYYCPTCGSKLLYLKEEDKDEEEDKVFNLECSNSECFMNGGVQWTVHHPFSFDRPRGDDSFSISYLN